MVIVVTGPPCSGKSTHIRERATPTDIIIDMDRIALALAAEGTAHHGYGQHIRHVARAARSAAIDAALQAHQVIDCNVWVIDTFPNLARWMAVGARIVPIDPGIDVCMARAAEQRPEWVQQIITEWYAKHKRG